MAITIEQALERCDATVDDTAEVLRCLDLANLLVADYIANAVTPVPEAVEDEAVLRTLGNIYSQTLAGENGVITADGSYVPGSPSWPLRRSRELLARYLPRV